MKIEMEEWEIETAKILGASMSQIENMTEDELDKLLVVTNRSSKKFYQHLEQHITFPFQSSYEEETGPLSARDHEVNCIRLDQDMEYDEFYGMFIECREGGKKVMVPLAELDVDEGNKNFELIDLYHGWFWSCR